MITLGFDTATPSTAVALRIEDAQTVEARDDPAPGERPRHTGDLLVLAAELLSQARLRFADLDAIAVGVGPGTFTGLRVGVASARGLAQSLGAPLTAVCSLRALALEASADAEGRPTSDASTDAEGRPTWDASADADGRPTLAVLDARRGEVFLAAYERRDGALVELAAPAALAPEQLAATLAELRAARAHPAPWLAVGDGACRYRSQLQAAGASVPPEGSPRHLLRAAAICELAAHADAAAGVEQVLPLYGRQPDAELALGDAGRAGQAIEDAGRAELASGDAGRAERTIGGARR